MAASELEVSVKGIHCISLYSFKTVTKNLGKNFEIIL